MQSSDISPEELKRLTRAPKVAWPTLALFFICLSGLGCFYYLALNELLPMWVATIANGVITYFFFSVVHDSSHGAISRHKGLNDFFGHVGMLFFGPLAPLNFARWIHMQHHRFTNNHDKDPDAFGHKKDIFTVIRWLNFDYFYTKFFLQNAGPMRKKFMPRLVMQILFVIVVVIVATLNGYGYEILMLWLLPTRISSYLFVACFVYLPHAPYKATAQEDEYQASNIRAGFEWLLTPLLAYQNYHLVHHLYPSAPFYQYIKIWRARYDFHMSHDPFFVGTFSLGKSVAPPAKKGSK